MAEQQVLPFRTGWGGARAGAGRPRSTKPRGYVPHVRRPAVSWRKPHHVTVRFTRGTWNVRSQRCFDPVREALATVKRERASVRVVQFSVQHDHVHLLIEADDRSALSSAMRALLIRVARGLNRVMKTRGRRVADRYHEHVLTTPTEVRNALRYVLGNRAHHLAKRGKQAPMHDPYASDDAELSSLIRPPRSWLLREGWTRAGP